MVEFRFGNLARDAPPGGGFDLVLCRHVLMYFAPAQAERALERIREAMAPDGWLLVGSAEAGVPCAIGLDKACAGDVTFHRRRAFVPSQLPTSRSPRAGVDAWRPSARRALRGCEEALRSDRCNASLHWLHAGLLEAVGELQGARQALRRALFLDGDFLPAHVAMARVGDRQGDGRLARRHLAHARRLLDCKRVTGSRA
jgi:chemotaxis protein methyltransferase CheR